MLYDLSDIYSSMLTKAPQTSTLEVSDKEVVEEKKETVGVAQYLQSGGAFSVLSEICNRSQEVMERDNARNNFVESAKPTTSNVSDYIMTGKSAPKLVESIEAPAVEAVVSKPVLSDSNTGSYLKVTRKAN